MGWGGFFCHCASGNSPRFLFESMIEEPFSFSLLRLHLPPFVTEKLGFRIYLKDKKWCLTSQHRTWPSVDPHLGLPLHAGYLARCHSPGGPRVASWLVVKESGSGIEEQMRVGHLGKY